MSDNPDTPTKSAKEVSATKRQPAPDKVTNKVPDSHHGMGGLYTVGATGQRELTHRTTPQFAQETRS